MTILEKEMPFRYRMCVDGIPERYAGYWGHVESDAPSRWGDAVVSLQRDESDEGTLAFGFKWMPLRAGRHILTVKVYPNPMLQSEPGAPEMTTVMKVRVEVASSDVYPD